MISATLTIGAILTVALLIISVIIVKVTPQKSFASYYPALAAFVAGLVLLLFATLMDRITVAGTGLGGWGIACAVASAITLLVTVVFDVFRQSTTA